MEIHFKIINKNAKKTSCNYYTIIPNLYCFFCSFFFLISMLGDAPNTTPSPSQVDMMFEDVFCVSSDDANSQHFTSPFGFDLSSPNFTMDFTPDFQFPSNSPSTSKKRKRKDNPDKSRIAQQRRRDTRGQFLRKDVASRLEGLFYL